MKPKHVSELLVCWQVLASVGTQDLHVHVYLSSSSQVAHCVCPLVGLCNVQLTLAKSSVQLERGAHGTDARVTNASLWNHLIYLRHVVKELQMEILSNRPLCISS